MSVRTEGSMLPKYTTRKMVCNRKWSLHAGFRTPLVFYVTTLKTNLQHHRLSRKKINNNTLNLYSRPISPTINSQNISSSKGTCVFFSIGYSTKQNMPIHKLPFKSLKIKFTVAKKWEKERPNLSVPERKTSKLILQKWKRPLYISRNNPLETILIIQQQSTNSQIHTT